jgi:hypothetical protein
VDHTPARADVADRYGDTFRIFERFRARHVAKPLPVLFGLLC